MDLNLQELSLEELRELREAVQADLQVFSLEELKELQRAVQAEIALRERADAKLAQERNAKLREARPILQAAGIGSLVGWERPGDHRLYVNPIDDRGERWRGSSKYRVYFFYLVEGNAHLPPGWHCSQEHRASEFLPEVRQAVETALALLGETVESAARSGFRL